MWETALRKFAIAFAILALSACSSVPMMTPSEPSGFTEEAMKGGAYRIAYTAPAEDVTAKTVADRTLARAAQITLDKGNEWFEISSKVDGKTDGKRTQTLTIQMGKGESLAGGPKQYDAKQTLASLKGKIG
jgi:hypothetical protein